MARRHPVLFPAACARAVALALALSAPTVLSASHAHASPATPPAAASDQPEAHGVQGGTSTQDPWGPPVETAAVAPEAPDALRAEALGPTTARLTWQPAGEPHNVAGYQVFQQGTSTPVADVAADSRSVRIGSLEPGISYTFAVRAVSSDGGTAGAASQVELTMPERPKSAGAGSRG